MKEKEYIDGDNKIFYKVNNLDDLLDAERFYLEKYTWLRYLFKNRKKNQEREARRRAKNYVRLFLYEMSNDLIKNNNTFIFPMKSFGSIYIGDINRPDIKNYRYSIDHDGKVFSPRIALNKDYLKVKAYCRIRFTNKTHRLLLTELAKGHKY